MCWNHFHFQNWTTGWCLLFTVSECMHSGGFLFPPHTTESYTLDRDQHPRHESFLFVHVLNWDFQWALRKIPLSADECEKLCSSVKLCTYIILHSEAQTSRGRSHKQTHFWVKGDLRALLKTDLWTWLYSENKVNLWEAYARRIHNRRKKQHVCISENSLKQGGRMRLK